ncbi:MAG: hypothetical protein QM831_44740 [Kofleriaceae bacterium]
MPDEDLDDAVMRAAVSNDPSLAMLLVRRAAVRIAANELVDAAADLESASRLHAEAGATVDEARSRQALATVQRTLGALPEAETNARRAIAIAPEKSPFIVAAHTELGETMLLTGRPKTAIEHYQAALTHGASIGMIAVAKAALHRRMAIAHSIAGEHTAAALEADEAALLYERAGDRTAATRARIESATALVEAGLGGAATEAIQEARTSAGDNAGAQAELDILEAARALKEKDLDTALALAQKARQHALDGNALLPYVSSALVIAEMLEQKGDRVGAYESLAVGWVTAADKIGNDLAGTIFREPLRSQKERWGDAEFDRVKATYYARPN